MIYVYDGTFEGFLTAVSTARERGDTPEAITPTPPAQAGLFSEAFSIETDPDRVTTLAIELRNTLSPDARRTLWYAFHTSAPGVELLLWRYLERGLSVGRALDGMLAHAEVLPVWKLARAVGREAHRYKGLVRFRELVDGSWYAAIEPEHRILPLIAHHFTARFADQRWIIHDRQRDIALIFDPAHRRPLLMDMAVTGPAPLAAEEYRFTELWRRYFDRLAIAERHNPPLQRQQLPFKYRRHLVEFTEE